MIFPNCKMSRRKQSKPNRLLEEEELRKEGRREEKDEKDLGENESYISSNNGKKNFKSNIIKQSHIITF